MDDAKPLKLSLMELRHAAIRVLGDFDEYDIPSLTLLREQIQLSFYAVKNYNSRMRNKEKGERAESGSS